MSLDAAGLIGVLTHTLSGDASLRGSAEASLAAFERAAGAHGLLLQLIMAPDAAVAFEVRQAAVLRLKNIYCGYGSIRAGDLCRITDSDRACMKSTLFPAILQQKEARLRVQLLEVVFFVWNADAPEEWPQLIPSILAALQSATQSQPPDLLRIYASVCTLRIVCKKYELRRADIRKGMWPILSQAWPALLSIGQTLAALKEPHSTEETRSILHQIIKIIYIAMNMAIPPEGILDFEGKCAPWFDIMIFLMQQPQPSYQSIPNFNPSNAGAHLLEVEERLAHLATWKCLKWSANLLCRVYYRFGRSKYIGGTEDTGQKITAAEKNLRIKWASQFEQKYTVILLETFLNILKKKAEGNFVSEPVLRHALEYLLYAVDGSATYKLLKPHLPYLLTTILFQQICLRPSELILYAIDPQEFIRRNLDMEREFVDPRTSAILVLGEILAYRTRDSLHLLLAFIEQTMATVTNLAANPQTRNNITQMQWIAKEGAMHIFGLIKRLLFSQKKNFADGMEKILIQHILPEFASPQGFVRSRACWVLRRYTNLKWANQQAQQASIVAAVTLLSDRELPVKMESWECISYLIEQDEICQFIKPAIPTIVQSFYTLFEEIGSESIVGVLHVMVDKFGNEIAPFAINLVNKLSEICIKLLEPLVRQEKIREAADQAKKALKENPHDPALQQSAALAEAAAAAQALYLADDDIDREDDVGRETIFNATATINAVLNAVDEHEELYRFFLPACDALLSSSLHECCIEFYENVLEIINIFCMYPEKEPIPACMWKYLPSIINSFHIWANDFLFNMLPPLDSYLAKGQVILTSDTGLPMLKGIMDISMSILRSKERLIDAPYACVLAASILNNMKGRVDFWIPSLLEVVGSRLLYLISLEEEREAERKRKAAERLRKKNKKAGKKGKNKKGYQRPEEESEDDADKAEVDNDLALLKWSLLEVLGLIVYYNPLLFVNVLKQAPQEFQLKLFTGWFSFCLPKIEDYDVGKASILAAGALLAMPAAQWPDSWKQGVSLILNSSMLALKEMKDMLDEDEKKNAEVDEIEAKKQNGHNNISIEEEEDDNRNEDWEIGPDMFHDIDENTDVYLPEREKSRRKKEAEDQAEADKEADDDDQEEDDEDLDDADAEEGSDAEFINDLGDSFLNDDSDFPKFISPLDAIEPFAFFLTALESLSKGEAGFYNQWVQGIGKEGQTALQIYSEEAKKQMGIRAAEAEKKAKAEAEKKARQAQLPPPPAS